jgi:hypothetical protein
MTPIVTQVIEVLGTQLSPDLSVKDRIATFWSVVVESRDLGSTDVVAEVFTELADRCGLTAALGRHGREDVDHVVRWGLAGLNPFAGGPLQ